MSTTINKADDWGMFINWFPEIAPRFLHNVTFKKIEITMEDGSIFLYERRLKTKVKFLIERWDSPNPDVFAYFPDEEYNDNPDLRCCYSHVGQHSACHWEYAMECVAATEEQYLPLKKELESIGYELEVLSE